MIYPHRYTAEPRKRSAYEEACDLIAIYGVPRKNWHYKRHNITRNEMCQIWHTAWCDMNGKSHVDCIYKG